MTGFKEYIKSHNYTLYNIYAESLVDFFGVIDRQKICNELANNIVNDYILENLLTHDNALLKKQIKELIDDAEFEDIYPDKNNKNSFILYSSDINNDKLIDLINFFGYYISKIDVDSETPSALICPTYTTNVTKDVAENNYILYHFTTQNKKNSILKNGLRIKDSRYRKFPKRIYLYISKNAKNITTTAKSIINKVVNPFDRQRYGLCILKIDLHKGITSYINFYKDDMMEEDGTVFTYTNIPAECIEEIS